LVLADGARLPFRDKQFDFVVCSHVLEHVSDPKHFLDEISRVGRAGYIETPNAAFERLVPYDVHCLEVSADAEGLVIAKKPQAFHDQVLSALLDGPARESWMRMLSSHPELFHVRFYWRDQIPYRILNENVDSSWIRAVTPAGAPPPERPDGAIGEVFYEWGVRWANAAFIVWVGRKNRDVDLASLLVCLNCKGSLVVEPLHGYRCERCQKMYMGNPWPTFVDD
jgi:SAM-dependent methyltransferase